MRDRRFLYSEDTEDRKEKKKKKKTYYSDEAVEKEIDSFVFLR